MNTLPFVRGLGFRQEIEWREKLEDWENKFIRSALMLEKYRKPFELLLKDDMSAWQIQFELGIDEVTCLELLQDLEKYYLALCKDGVWTVTVQGKHLYNKYYVHKATTPLGKAECQHCGSLIPEKANPCPRCGEFREWCAVCKMDIAPGEATTKCPHCNTKIHSDHFIEWIKVKGYCPNCKRDLC